MSMNEVEVEVIMTCHMCEQNGIPSPGSQTH